MRFPYSLSDSSVGLLVILLLIAGGLMWIYNAWRLGRLPWKPKGAPNPKLVCAVILTGILVVFALPFFVT